MHLDRNTLVQWDVGITDIDVFSEQLIRDPVLIEHVVEGACPCGDRSQ